MVWLSTLVCTVAGASLSATIGSHSERLARDLRSTAIESRSRAGILRREALASNEDSFHRLVAEEDFAQLSEPLVGPGVSAKTCDGLTPPWAVSASGTNLFIISKEHASGRDPHVWAARYRTANCQGDIAESWSLDGYRQGYCYATNGVDKRFGSTCVQCAEMGEVRELRVGTFSADPPRIPSNGTVSQLNFTKATSAVTINFEENCGSICYKVGHASYRYAWHSSIIMCPGAGRKAWQRPATQETRTSGFEHLGQGCCRAGSSDVHGHATANITMHACKALCKSKINCTFVEFDSQHARCVAYNQTDLNAWTEPSSCSSPTHTTCWRRNITVGEQAAATSAMNVTNNTNGTSDNTLSAASAANLRDTCMVDVSGLDCAYRHADARILGPRNLAVFFDSATSKFNYTCDWPPGANCESNIPHMWRVARDAVNPLQQMTLYEPAVGVDMTDVAAVYFGLAVKKRALNAYRWLSENYQTGDKIFMFGASQGASAARMLQGLIYRVGLAKPFTVLEATYVHFHEGETIAAEFKKNDAKVFQNVQVDFVGLFDAPLKTHLEYVDKVDGRSLHLKMTSVVKKLVHALSLDEYRERYEAAELSVEPETQSEQVWFMGMHGDVGGGNFPPGAARIAAAWMLDKANESGLLLKTGWQTTESMHMDANGNLGTESTWHFPSSVQGQSAPGLMSPQTVRNPARCRQDADASVVRGDGDDAVNESAGNQPHSILLHKSVQDRMDINKGWLPLSWCCDAVKKEMEDVGFSFASNPSYNKYANATNASGWIKLTFGMLKRAVVPEIFNSPEYFLKATNWHSAQHLRKGEHFATIGDDDDPRAKGQLIANEGHPPSWKWPTMKRVSGLTFEGAMDMSEVTVVLPYEEGVADMLIIDVLDSDMTKSDFVGRVKIMYDHSNPGQMSEHKIDDAGATLDVKVEFITRDVDVEEALGGGPAACKWMELSIGKSRDEICSASASSGEVPWFGFGSSQSCSAFRESAKSGASPLTDVSTSDVAITCPFVAIMLVCTMGVLFFNDRIRLVRADRAVLLMTVIMVIAFIDYRRCVNGSSVADGLFLSVRVATRIGSNFFETEKTSAGKFAVMVFIICFSVVPAEVLRQQIDKTATIRDGLKKERLDLKSAGSEGVATARYRLKCAAGLFFIAVMIGAQYFNFFKPCSCRIRGVGCIDADLETCLRTGGSQNSVFDLFLMSLLTVSMMGFGDGTQVSYHGKLVAVPAILFGVGAWMNLLFALAEFLMASRQAEARLHELDNITSDDAKKQFKVLDLNGNGSLSKTEFRLFMLLQNNLVTQDMVDKIDRQFDCIDERHTNELTFDMFKTASIKDQATRSGEQKESKTTPELLSTLEHEAHTGDLHCVPESKTAPAPLKSSPSESMGREKPPQSDESTK